MPPTTSTLSLATKATVSPDVPDPATTDGVRALGAVAAGWGVVGQVALLLVAVRQLLRAAIVGLAAADPSAATWGLAAASVAALCYFQGYRGFQRHYSPLVAARAAHLARNPHVWHAVVAPLYVCGLVHASRRRRIATVLLFAIMPALAVGVSRLPEPYRAIVDLGVACGLIWGTVALLVFAARAAAGRAPAASLDLPASARR